MTDTIVARYVNPDAYLPGLPARDLTMADIQASEYSLPVVLEAKAYGRKLYEPVAAIPDATTPAKRTKRDAPEVTNG